MEKLQETFNQLVQNNDFLIGVVIACVVILILIFLITFMKRKAVKKQLKEAETHYNSLKSIPLPFKINKAESLARVNPSVVESVDKSRIQNQNVQDALKECSILLGEIDDLIYVHKAGAAKKQLRVLNEKLDACDKEATTLSAVLDSILEQESTQRDQINRLKTQFRVDKEIIAGNRDSFNSGIEVLEAKILNIEKMFSTFEEWMFASEFNKAGQQQVEIVDAIEELELLIKEFPMLYEEAKRTLPKAIDETSYIYSTVRNKGVYLEHLEISRNIEAISSMLKDDLNRLHEGNIENVMNSMVESRKRLAQLRDQIQREEKAYDELHANINYLYETISRLNDQISLIRELYERVKERFGFENIEDQLSALENACEKIVKDKQTLKNLIDERSIPATTLLISYKDLGSDTNDTVSEFERIKGMLENACADEQRAKKQLLKLQLILNEINVKISKNRLPSVSLTYEEDLRKANCLVKEVGALLEASPLDIAVLNERTKEAIDFVYTLYNSVNNLVGMAIMVENTIVFGNRYRSSYPEVDSELTRAELCFRNGQYTKALKIAIQTIEKMHPGSYEKLLHKSKTGA